MTGIYLIITLIIGTSLFLNQNKIVNYILLWSFVAIQWLFTIYSCYHFRITELQYFTFDALGLLLLITLSIIAIPAAIHSQIYIETHEENAKSRSIYFGALIILISAISVGYLANNIAVIWIFTEITTLSASALIYHHRNKLALEGTWKYLFVCALSITFVFIGILFLSLSLENTGNKELSFENLLTNSKQLNTFWLKLAFLFIFTGFTAKLGLVPMFTAGIDAKDKAPAPAGALFASVLINLGFVGIFRTYIVIANTPIHQWANIVIAIAAFLSILVATVYMIKVKNIKRMFAYSSIEHMGIVMFGIVAGGVGYYAAILHIILHSFVKSSMFFQYNQLYRIFQSKSIYHLGNYFKYNPAGAIVLLIGFIFAAAMPPSGLFVSEFLIFRSMFEAKMIPLLLVILLLLTIIVWAFGKNMLKILFLPPVDFDESNLPKMNSWESLTQYLLLASCVYLGLNPPIEFINLINESIALLPK